MFTTRTCFVGKKLLTHLGTCQANFPYADNNPQNVYVFFSFLRCYIFLIPRFSDISGFPDLQIALDELSDPNLTPLPTQLGIKYVARSHAILTASI